MLARISPPSLIAICNSSLVARVKASTFAPGACLVVPPIVAAGPMLKVLPQYLYAELFWMPRLMRWSACAPPNPHCEPINLALRADPTRHCGFLGYSLMPARGVPCRGNQFLTPAVRYTMRGSSGCSRGKSRSADPPAGSGQPSLGRRHARAVKQDAAEAEAALRAPLFGPRFLPAKFAATAAGPTPLKRRHGLTIANPAFSAVRQRSAATPDGMASGETTSPSLAVAGNVSSRQSSQHPFRPFPQDRRCDSESPWD